MRLLSLLPILAALCFGAYAPPLQAAEERFETGPSAPSAWDDLVFQIEDSKCRVGIASVKLSVSTLKKEGRYLVGEYSIEVPLMQSKNDRGRILLPLDQTVNDLGENGGTLRGQAISHKKGAGKRPNEIICQVLPQKDQTILLAITTSDRTIKFKSRYSVTDTESGS